MDKKDEALKLALEALNALEQVAEYFNVDSTETKTIIALRERLAQPDPVLYWHSEFLKHNTTSEQPAQQQEPGRSCNDAYELIMKWADIYAAQTGRIYSEAAQDPTKTAKMADERTMLACAVAQALSQPAQQQEPVAWMYDCGGGGRMYAEELDGVPGWTPLYTSPPASKPLTDQAVWNLYKNLWMFHPAEEPRLAGDILKFARAIEAAHGITGETK